MRHAETPAASRSGERGVGLLRALVALAIVVALVYGAFKFIPVRAAAFQLDDEVREQVVLAGARRRQVTDEQVRTAILARAEDLGLPLQARDIRIERGHSWIKIHVAYTVPVQLPFGYVFPWKFSSEHQGPAF